MIDINKFKNILEKLLEEAENAQSPHNSIKFDDDQYEDPEEWILRPLIKHIKNAIKSLEN